MPIQTFNVNGETVEVDVADDVRVLWVLRDLLGVTGPKYGCGLGVCQACTSHINGEAFNPCSVPVGDLKPTDQITTIEGLAASVGQDLHPAQQVWIDRDVAQCGFCQPGQIMAAVDLVRKANANGHTITDDDLDTFRNICRCGTYPKVREAIKETQVVVRERPDLDTPVVPPPVTEATGTASAFVSLQPIRLFDTREEYPETAGPKGPVGPMSTIDVEVAGHAGVPEDAVAVVMNITVTNVVAESHVTVWPTGSPMPLASAVNVGAGETRPNLVTVPIGTNGQVSMYAHAQVDLVGDVQGYFQHTEGTSSAGRFVPVAPNRLFDSREDQAAPGPKGAIAAGGAVDIDIAGVGGLPTEGIGAVVVNLTGTGSAAAGYLTAYPAGSARPGSSNVNFDGAGQTAANLAVIPLGDDGKATVYSSHGAHALIDVMGYLTDGTADEAASGLFVALTPDRFFDTRASQPAPGPKGRVPADGEVAATLAGVGEVPDDATGVVANVVAIGAGPGHLTVWPTGSDRPVVSTLNTVEGDTRANGAWLPVGDDGKVSFHSYGGSDLLADVAGYFLP